MFVSWMVPFCVALTGTFMLVRAGIMFMRRERIDILHAHKFGANLAGVVIGRLTGVPVIAHEHGLRASPSPARRLADRLIGRLAAVVLCVSEADRDRLVTTEHLPPRKVRHTPTPNIHNAPKFATSRWTSPRRTPCRRPGPRLGATSVCWPRES